MHGPFYKGPERRNMGYSWTPREGMAIVGINLRTNIRNQRIKCPYCRTNSFIMETAGGYGKCWSCGFKADVPQYVAAVENITVAEARHKIEEYYGYDKNDWKTKERVVYREPKVVEAPTVPNEVLDDTYRAFLSELQLKDSSRFEMKARCGIDDNSLEALCYRTYPQYDEINFFSLCERLQRDGHILEGVPGFFKAKKGEGSWMFPTFTEGIITPLVNIQNQIIGLHLRKEDSKRVCRENNGEMDLEPKCAWFSSKGGAHGAAAHCGVHYAVDFRLDIDTHQFTPVFPDGGVILTEGIMKADIIHYLMPNLPVLAVEGVECTSTLAQELENIKKFGVDTVKLAYDMDYVDNPNVKNAMEKTKKIIHEAGMNLSECEWDTKIEEDDSVYLKGLDDYLAYAIRGIRPKVKELEEHKNDR